MRMKLSEKNMYNIELYIEKGDGDGDEQINMEKNHRTFFLWLW